VLIEAMYLKKKKKRK